jgi:hypothetical protein
VGAETVRVDVPEPPGRLTGLSVAVRLAGVFSTSPTFALKPRILVTVIVEEHEEPATTAIKKGLAEISKSDALTLTTTTVEAWTGPAVPTTSMK